MKYPYLILVFLMICFGSCSTAYRNMQTPDDVYYSDGQPEGTVLEDQPAEYATRMKCRDRRWRDMDDYYGYGCGYDPYHYGYNSWYYYNPHYYPYPVFVYAPVINSTPRTTSLGSYYNTSFTVVNTKTGQSTVIKGSGAYNNSNRNSGILRVFDNAGSPSGTGGGTRVYSASGSGGASSSGSSIIRPSRN